MKEFIFRLTSGHARLLSGDSAPCDKARLRFENGDCGTLLLAGRRFDFPPQGAILSADALKEGVFTPSFYLHGQRFEGPPITVGAGYLFFLPPSHAHLCQLQEQLDRLTEENKALTKRIAAMESRVMNTNIF